MEGKSVEQYYDALISHPLWRERFSGMKEIARYCGPVPCGTIKKPFKDRVMVIGDAAGMAKPTTGGGIGPGFRQVEAIVEKLTMAIQKDKLEASTYLPSVNPSNLSEGNRIGQWPCATYWLQFQQMRN